MIDHLWTFETAKLVAPVRWRFAFEVRASREELWPSLMDTTRLNRAMGLTEIEYVEEGGLLRGSTRTFGIRYRWVEPPWAWVSGKWVSCFRIYDDGLATHGSIGYQIEPASADESRVKVAFDWYPRNALCRLMLRRIEPQVRAAYARAFRRVELELAEQPRHTVLAKQAPPLPPETRRRLAAIRERLRDGKVRVEVVDKLLSHIEEGDELELARIRVRPLARRWRLDERELIVACLHATRAGLLQLDWDSICPYCRGVKHAATTLGDVPRHASCAACQAEFTTDDPHAVEITFQIHPSIRAVPQRTYCLSEASEREHIRLQQPLSPGQRRSFETALDPGRYRARVIGEKRYQFLDVIEGPAAPGVTIGEDWDESIEAGPAPTVTLVNTSDQRRVFVIEDVRWVDDALRPVHLFNLQEFRDLFSAERLAADVQIQIGEQAILFSDIVGSTRFYERHGDTAAFAAVKQHFRQVYDEVRRHRGVVVKTIGDAAMAAFIEPSDALRAALGLQRRFRAGGEHDGFRLRISLNFGSCVAVNLNSGIDYFGRTVNLAAKLQSCVSSGQIAFPAAMRNDARVEELVEALKPHFEEILLELPSLGEPISVCRLDTDVGTHSSVEVPSGAGFG
jgi:class 3 adenylate cyclase